MSFIRRFATNAAKVTTTQASPAPAKGATSAKPGKLLALLQLSKDIVPGDTTLKKGIFSTALAAISAYLVNSGLYVPGEETLTLTSFLLLCRIGYLKAGKPLADYLDAEIAAEERRWYAARAAEKNKYATQLKHLEAFRDYPLVVQTVYDMQAANLVLEDAVQRAQQRAKLHAELSQKAQELVRKEQQRLLEEARERRALLRIELDKLLEDDSVQQRIVEKFIRDMKTLPVVTLPALN